MNSFRLASSDSPSPAEIQFWPLKLYFGTSILQNYEELLGWWLGKFCGLPIVVWRYEHTITPNPPPGFGNFRGAIELKTQHFAFPATPAKLLH